MITEKRIQSALDGQIKIAAIANDMETKIDNLQQENAQLKYELELARKTIRELDSTSEFGAENLHITTHPVIGLQRWDDKQYMLSFFPTNVKGEEFEYLSGIGKVYDLLLTEEQVESIVRAYENHKKHPFKDETNSFDLPIKEEDYRRWQNGDLAQDCFPYLSADEREFLISGIPVGEFDDCVGPFEGVKGVDMVFPISQKLEGELARLEEEIKTLEETDAEKQERIESGNLDSSFPKIDKPIRDSSPVSKKIYSSINFRPERLRQLRPILNLIKDWPEIILAGGAIRTILTCCHEEVSDYDLFFKTFSVVPDFRKLLKEFGYKETYACPEEKLFTYKKNNQKIQLICETEYNSPQSLIESFDVTACVGAYHQGAVYFSRPFIRAVKTKRLRINNVTFPVATIKRLTKYANKGYNIGQAALDFMHEISGKTFDGEFLRAYID